MIDPDQIREYEKATLEAARKAKQAIKDNHPNAARLMAEYRNLSNKYNTMRKEYFKQREEMTKYEDFESD